MDDVFRLAGAVVTPGGERVRDLHVAVVAKGWSGDIRLGSGKTDALGEFRCWFTTREFNLDRLIFRRAWPEIRLVFAVEREGRLAVVHRYGLPPDFGRSQTIDLGEIVIAAWDVASAEPTRRPIARRRLGSTPAEPESRSGVALPAGGLRRKWST